MLLRIRIPLSPPSLRSPCKKKKKIYVLRGGKSEKRGSQRDERWESTVLEGKQARTPGFFRRSLARCSTHFSFLKKKLSSFSPSLVHKGTMPAPAGPKILNRAAATPATPAKAAPKILVKAAAKDVPSSAAASNGGAAAFGERSKWFRLFLPLFPSSRQFECCSRDARKLRSRFRSRWEEKTTRRSVAREAPPLSMGARFARDGSFFIFLPLLALL